MNKWFREPNWWLFFVTLIIGGLGFISAEYGPLFNKPKIQFFVASNTIDISHNYGTIYIDFPVDLIKTGRGDKSIAKMQLFVQRYDGKYEMLFNWNKPPMTISNNLANRIDVRFVQEIDLIKYKDYWHYMKAVKQKLYVKFKNEGWGHKAYFLDDGDRDVIKLQEFVRSLLSGLLPSKYKALVVAFEDFNDSEPIWSAAYSFELSESMINDFVLGQLSSYDSDPDLNPRYLTYKSSPIIEKLNEEQKDRLLRVYKSYLSKKPLD